MPRFSDHFVKSLIRLVRQSTQVPNTSKTSAFTPEMSDMVATSFLSFRDGPKDQTRNLEVPQCAIAHWGSMLRIAPERRLEFLPILHEAWPVCDLVVEQLRGFVGLVGHPIETAGAGSARSGFHRRYQLASRAAAT